MPFKFALLRKYRAAWKKFNITRKKTGYDLLIIGSDEMWPVKEQNIETTT